MNGVSGLGFKNSNLLYIIFLNNALRFLRPYSLSVFEGVFFYATMGLFSFFFSSTMEFFFFRLILYGILVFLRHHRYDQNLETKEEKN